MNILSQVLQFILGFIGNMLKSFVKKVQDAGTRAMFGKDPKVLKQHFYELVDKDMSFKEVPMSNFKGSVLLVTNVASQWGLTKQNYTEFSALADELGPRGLKILAFPCNQFGAQEPGNHEEILNFVDQFECRDKLTWFKKGQVNGGKFFGRSSCIMY